MTEEIAATDAYARETDATVVAAGPEGVVLDRTVFYARGGGQPGDTGTLSWDGGSATVADTVKASGDVLHLVAEGSPVPPVGAVVHAAIDWDRRHLLMRTHTAVHVLTAVMFRDHGAKATGSNLDHGSGRLDYELDAVMQPGFAEEVERRLNEELGKDAAVSVLFLPRAEALADPDLIRTKVNLIPEHVDPIRVIDIEGVDRQADGGTHVRSTGEVGRVRVTKTENKGRSFKRVRIEVER
jgi:misacylated tRNA(Ala) deacylase